MLRGYNQRKELNIGIFHYQAGDDKILERFLRQAAKSLDHGANVAVIGGYRSPVDDPGSGSEEDLKEIQEVFTRTKFSIFKTIFNPTDSDMDTEEVDSIDVKVDRWANFSYRGSGSLDWIPI